jgi:hypothetical protein
MDDRGRATHAPTGASRMRDGGRNGVSGFVWTARKLVPDQEAAAKKANNGTRSEDMLGMLGLHLFLSAGPKG